MITILSQTAANDFLPYGSLIVAVIVASVTGLYALKGKKVDAGQWITDTLKADAETNRAELKQVRLELENLKKKADKEINLMKQAILSLHSKEKEMAAYINLLEKEINILKELLILQGGATPDQEILLQNIEIPEDLSNADILNIINGTFVKDIENADQTEVIE